MRSPWILTLALLGACTDSAPKKPNVILITLDTTRADYISCYGKHPGITPNIDAIAAEGTRFDMAISTAGVTPVSHASILTGLNNQSHKLRVLSADSGYKLPEDIPTLATVFAAAGYHTVAVHSAFPVSRTFGFKRGFEVFEDFVTEMKPSADGAKQSWDVVNNQRRSDATTDLVESVIGERQPYFLWIHYWDPHDAVLLPPEGQYPPREQLIDPETGEAKRPWDQLYSAELRYQDQQIGRLMDELKRRGLLENTVIAITADHGQGLMEHNWPAHRLLYQEQVHVPLIVKAPGAKAAPTVADLVRTIDIFPTLLDFAQLASPKPIDGRSLRPLMERKPDEKRVAFGDQINGYDKNAGMTEKRPLDHFLYMAIDWPWKLIYRPFTPEQSEMYDLAADPDEASNQYVSRPEIALQLRKLLAKAHPWVPGPFEGEQGLTDEEIKALSGLGYVVGQTIDASWSWTCPEHMDEDLGSPAGRCPKCKEPALMIKR